MKLSDLAVMTGARTEGSLADVDITGAAGLEEAGPGQVTFLANPRYAAKVATTAASAIFVKPDDAVYPNVIALRVGDPYLAYTKTLRFFHPEPPVAPFVHPAATIDPSASIADDVSIGAYVIIAAHVRLEAGVRVFPNVTIYERAVIGEGSVLHSGVSIREDTVIGKRVVIHNNSVVGSDGFGFAKDEQGHWLKIPQTGRVVIEDDVELGACTTIDRASVGETRISRGVKIDNQVQVGHSCTVGEDTLLCGQVGLAGSSHIGRNVILAGQVGIGGHLSVGDGAVLMAQAGTFSDVPAGKVLSGGIPAFDHHESLRAMAAFRKLPATQRMVRELQNRLSALEALLPSNGSSSPVK